MARYKKSTYPKLNRKLILKLSNLIATGCYIETAVKFCGISKDTYYRWLKESKRENPENILLELSYALESAKAISEMNDLKLINQAAQGVVKSYKKDEQGNLMYDEFGLLIVEEYLIKPNWKAAAWRLSKRFPQEWGARSSTEKKEAEFDISSLGTDISDLSERIKRVNEIQKKYYDVSSSSE